MLLFADMGLEGFPFALLNVYVFDVIEVIVLDSSTTLLLLDCSQRHPFSQDPLALL